MFLSIIFLSFRTGNKNRHSVYKMSLEISFVISFEISFKMSFCMPFVMSLKMPFVILQEM